MHKLAPNLTPKLAPKLPKLLRTHTSPLRGVCACAVCAPEIEHVR
jgi:hypothetical protein